MHWQGDGIGNSLDSAPALRCRKWATQTVLVPFLWSVLVLCCCVDAAKPELRAWSTEAARAEGELLQSRPRETPAPRPTPSPAARCLQRLTAKLREIDEQLLAVQNIAQSIEQDFPGPEVLDRHSSKVESGL